MPVKCQCEICLRPCKKNQCAIQCDMCGGWIHLKCIVISLLKFHTLCSSTEPYLCQNCCSELFPFQTLDDKQLLNEMRNDDKLNFDINHTNNSFFPAKCLQVDNKIKSLLNDLNSGLVDSKYCSQAEANIINKKYKFSLLCVNIRSLNANFDKLNELLTNYDILPDIIAISETKLKLLQARMAVRYGTFRICVLRISHLEPYRTNVPNPYHYKNSVPYQRTVLLSKN